MRSFVGTSLEQSHPLSPDALIAPCLPTKTSRLVSGCRRSSMRGAQVRLYSRPGNDFTRRFPLSRLGRAEGDVLANPIPRTEAAVVSESCHWSTSANITMPSSHGAGTEQPRSHMTTKRKTSSRTIERRTSSMKRAISVRGSRHPVHNRFPHLLVPPNAATHHGACAVDRCSIRTPANFYAHESGIGQSAILGMLR